MVNIGHLVGQCYYVRVVIRKRLHVPFVVILFLIFWAVSLRHLTAVPPVYEDEPWQASTGWKLASAGVFGSDLFAGFYGMEDHYYGYMPMHPFFLAAVFKLTGLGLFQARFEPVVMGLLMLAFTYALGRRLFRPSVGLLAVFLLLFSHTNGVTPSQYSGILLIDMARIARYDIVVPVFALAALLLYAKYHATYPLGITNFVLLGILTSLAALSHLYGLFWFAAFLLLLLWQKTTWQKMASFVFGFLLPWAVYIAYVLPGLSDWVGQTQDYAPRFELLNLGWYWQNVVNEIHRYGPGLGEDLWVRPGFWTAVIAIPLSLLALGRLAIQGQRKAQILLVPAIVLPALFALLIYLKLSNYLITIAPLFALAMAWGLMTIYTTYRPNKLIKFGLALLLGAIMVEGGWRFVQLEEAVADTTPYAEFSAEISQHLPPDGRILGLHNYWLGLNHWDYRSWFVPILQNNPDYWHPPLSIENALNGVDPTIILIDHRMRDFFESDPETAEAVFSWMMAEGFEQTAVVEDETYGRMDIYLRVVASE